MPDIDVIRVWIEIDPYWDDSSCIWRRIKARKRIDICSEAKKADLTAFEAERIRLA